jgi:fatty-acyl-CoA synthase
MKRVLDEMHCGELVIAYGQTETSPVVTMSDAADTIEIRVKTVGRAMPQTEIQIVSTITGETLPIGEQGEVCARGYAVMKGYDADPEGTALVIHPDGWLHTGDLGSMDARGYLRIAGRIKDMIIRGGENVYPREVEEFLHTHPDVSEAQVIGVPSEKYGEEVMAWVRCKPGVAITGDGLAAFCTGRIATYKIPRHWKLVDAFPMTVTGKVQKFRMREMAVEELGLHAAAGAKTA